MSVIDSENSPERYALSLEGEGVAISREVNKNVALEIIAMVMSGSRLPAPSEVNSGENSGTAQRPDATMRRAGRRTPAKKKATGPKRRAGSVGVVKDLGMRPAGKKSFADFIAEKQPRRHNERQVVIVAWLTQEAGISPITVEHVNTCYSEANWARPADLRNSMQVTSATKRWLDTGDMADIKLTTPGEDEVRHNLPPEKAAKK